MRTHGESGDRTVGFVDDVAQRKGDGATSCARW
jgi:hypothetical protein